MTEWRSWTIETFPNKQIHPSKFISFNDLQASRYCVSYITPARDTILEMEIAFISIDSEKISDDVNDAYHYDFGDNKMHKSNWDNECLDSDAIHIFGDKIRSYVPPSIAEYMMSDRI